MKKLITLSLLIGIPMISCQENSVEPVEESVPESEASATFRFTDAEVDELLSAEFGTTQLTFGQKVEFLNAHVLSLVTSGTKKTPSGRTAGEVAVFCAAGTYIHGVWTFNTDTGFTNEIVSARKTEQPEQATSVGSSASIWIDYNDNGAFGDGNDYYDNDYTAPTQPSCSGGAEVKGVAQSRRTTSGYITLYTYVDCDD